MAKLRIITDTASDITTEEAKALDITLVPLTIRFGEEEVPMDTEADFQAFFDRLDEAKLLPATSQPSPEIYLEQFLDAKAQGDEVLVLTLSSGLSGTVNSAQLAKEMSGYAPITIIDTRQAIITQRMLVERAVLRRTQGVSREAIAQELLEARDRMVVCGVLDTLTFLRKGGRIPPTFDIIGNALRIKPIIELKDGVLIKLGLVRGSGKGKEMLWRELEAVKVDTAWPICTGYTFDRSNGEAFRQETMARFGLTDCPFYPVGGVIGTHVGKNCLALAFVKKA